LHGKQSARDPSDQFKSPSTAAVTKGRTTQRKETIQGSKNKNQNEERKEGREKERKRAF